jgi:beta-xylosidase
LQRWEAHPAPLKALDFTWSAGGAFATKVIAHRDQYYWFISTQHQNGGTAIGIAKASKPEGPYTDAIGQALITMNDLPHTENDKANLDPSVLIDADGSAYLFWGNRQCHYVKLADDLLSPDGGIRPVDLPGFEEGAHLHQRNGWYYLSYGYGMPEKVAYAMSRSIHGPWEFKGILNELAGNCETNRPCIIDFKENSYFFYHNGGLKNGGSHRRSVCADRLYYNDDATIRRVSMTSEGV